MVVFLAVSQGGGVVDIVRARSFDGAYRKTIALNNGEVLVEITRKDFEELSELFGNKEKKVIGRIWDHITDDENNPEIGAFHHKANGHIKRILLKHQF